MLYALRRGGTVVVDNTLLSGSVAEGRPVGHWTQQMVDEMRQFNQRVLSDPALGAAWCRSATGCWSPSPASRRTGAHAPAPAADYRPMRSMTVHEALPVLRAARAVGLRTRDGAEVPIEVLDFEGDRLIGSVPRFRVSVGLELSARIVDPGGEPWTLRLRVVSAQVTGPETAKVELRAEGLAPDEQRRLDQRSRPAATRSWWRSTARRWWTATPCAAGSSTSRRPAWRSRPTGCCGAATDCLSRQVLHETVEAEVR